MRADQDVDLTRFHSLENQLLLFWCAEARNHLHYYGELFEALLEGLKVLKAENGRWFQHRHLASILHSLECRAHGYFSLTVPNVSAEQAIHRKARLHVALDIGDGGELIVGFVVVEGVFELTLELVVRRECMTLRGLALCIELEQFVSHVLHGLLDARLGLGPLLRAESIEYWSGSGVG